MFKVYICKQLFVLYENLFKGAMNKQLTCTCSKEISKFKLFKYIKTFKNGYVMRFKIKC